MARPRKKEMPATAVETKAVRLDLDMETHRQLRVVAAEEDMPMAIFARDVVTAAVHKRYEELRGKPKGKG
jgi:plasmid stability protein